MSNKKPPFPGTKEALRDIAERMFAPSKLDVLAENVQPVLAAKMTIYGFLEQACFFMESVKKSILTSQGGIDIATTAIILESSKQVIDYALDALKNYQSIQAASRSVTKLKLAQEEAANDNAAQDDEVTAFVHNRPNMRAPAKQIRTPEPPEFPGESDGEEEEVDLIDDDSTLSPTPPPSNKKLN